jgi:hypothetical protein
MKNNKRALNTKLRILPSVVKFELRQLASATASFSAVENADVAPLEKRYNIGSLIMLAVTARRVSVSNVGY